MAITKRGLTGNSGFIGAGIHLNMAYDCNGKVFAMSPKDVDGRWRRVTRKQAKAWGWSIIACAHCKAAATRLDHSYPYMSGANACDKHLDAGIVD